MKPETIDRPTSTALTLLHDLTYLLSGKIKLQHLMRYATLPTKVDQNHVTMRHDNRLQ